MVADGDERDAGRAGSDEADKGVGVVDGGSVEQIGHRFCKCSDCQENNFSWYSS